MFAKAFATALLAGLAYAALGQGQSVRPLPRVRLLFPTEIPSESIQIEYFLTGPFGGYGTILPAEKKHPFIDFAASVDGKPAENVKVIAYLPGCEYVTLDIPIEDSAIMETLRCNPLGTTRLHGRIVNDSMLGHSPAEIEVIYVPYWSHNFFHISDGMIPSIHLGTTSVRDGEFTVDLPDFGRQANLGAGTFEVILYHAVEKRWANLRPTEDGSASYGLTARSSYAPLVEFAIEQFQVESQAGTANQH